MKRRKIAAMLIAGSMMLMAGCGSKEIANEYVKISQYKGIEVDKVDAVKITDEEVENEIKSLLSAQTKEIKDRPLQEGDIALFDYTGKLKSTGEVFDEGSLSLGNGETYVPGFVEGIYGHKLNETFDMELTFPEGYGGEANPELSNAEVIFTVTITAISEPVHKELTDEVVKTLSEESDTVEEYKKEIRENLQKNNDQVAKTTLMENAWNKVMENVEVIEFPKKELEETEKMLDEYMRMVMEQVYGIEFAEYLETSSITEEDYKKQMKESAESYLKQMMAVELIAEKENLMPSEKEYEKKLEEYAKENGYSTTEELFEALGEQESKDAILQNIVLEWVADNCKQVEKK